MASSSECKRYQISSRSEEARSTIPMCWGELQKDFQQQQKKGRKPHTARTTGFIPSDACAHTENACATCQNETCTSLNWMCSCCSFRFGIARECQQADTPASHAMWAAAHLLWCSYSGRIPVWCRRVSRRPDALSNVSAPLVPFFAAME